MEAQTLKNAVKKDQKIQLVDGSFTPSEAQHVICSLLDEKINFHKLQRLTLWEGDHCCETVSIDKRIDELEEEKRIAKEFIAQSRGAGKNLKINGILEITLAD